MSTPPAPPSGPDPSGSGLPAYEAQAPGYAAQAAPQSSGKATASLVLGILGIVLCPLICSVAGLILGNQAKREIAASGGTITGEGSAKAGVILSWIGIGLAVLGIIIFVIAAAAGA